MPVNTTRSRADALRDFVAGRREEMVDLLRTLVDIESPTDHPKGTTEVATLLGERLADLSFDVRRLPSERYGEHLVADGGAAEGSRLFAVGHVDTVFPLGTGWGFSIDGDRAYGPGVIDMKSGDVALVFALRALHETGGIPLPVRVFYNTDEEPGSPESRELIPGLLEGCDQAFVLEPSEPNGTAVMRRKGVAIFDVAVTGRAAHAGQEPERGISANRELCALVLEAEALASKETGTTVNAGIIAGGTAAYVIPEHASCTIDVRVPDVSEQRRIEQGLAEICAVSREPGTEIRLGGGFHRPPMTPGDGTQRLLDAYQRAAAVAGQAITFDLSGAASDGNTIAGCGVPVIDGLGGIGGRAHSSEEYLELESLFDRTLLLAHAIEQLALAPRP